MDLAFTADQEAFRREARDWLAANIPDEPLPSLDTAVGFELHRAWEQRLFDARWSVVNWPVEHGGRGLSIVEWLIFEEEYYASGAPGRVNNNGLSLLGPTLFEYGTDDQKQRFLSSMASGEIIWAQAWSEPDAGSDLAGIKSKATPVSPDDPSTDWLLNGQKTWCSRGAFADWAFGLFRSDPTVPRHQGMTYFLFPLDAPGVTVRPISRLNGDPAFAEIFLEDVRVPARDVLGGVNRGWNVAMATAGSERGLNLRSPGRYCATAARLVSLYQTLADDHAVDDPSVRDNVVRAWLAAEAYRWYTWQTVAFVQGGGHLGPEASLNKVWWSETDVLLNETALKLLGEQALLLRGAPSDVLGEWVDGFLFSLAGPIYAGTNEIQRNVIAERVLGLPRK